MTNECESASFPRLPAGKKSASGSKKGKNREEELKFNLAADIKKEGTEKVKSLLGAAYYQNVSFTGTFRQDVGERAGYKWSGNRAMLRTLNKPGGVKLWTLSVHELEEILAALKGGWLTPVLIPEHVEGLRTAAAMDEAVEGLALGGKKVTTESADLGLDISDDEEHKSGGEISGGDGDVDMDIN